MKPRSLDCHNTRLDLAQSTTTYRFLIGLFLTVPVLDPPGGGAGISPIPTGVCVPEPTLGWAAGGIEWSAKLLLALVKPPIPGGPRLGANPEVPSSLPSLMGGVALPIVKLGPRMGGALDAPALRSG